MSYLFENLYTNEEKIYVEVSKLFDKYNISFQNRNKENWIKCIRRINEVILADKKRGNNELILKLVNDIVSSGFSYDLIFRGLKCIENAYINYTIRNIRNLGCISDTLVLLNNFFYYIEKSIIQNKKYCLNEMNFKFMRKNLSTVIDNIPLIIIFEDENGKCIKFNKAARKFYGLKSVNGKSNYANNERIKTSIVQDNYEEIVFKDNKNFFLNVMRIPITLPNGQKITALIKNDITLMREARYENFNMIIKSIFDEMPQFIFVHDKGKILYANRVLLDFLELDNMEDIKGKNYNDFISIKYSMDKSTKDESRKYIAYAVMAKKKDGREFDVKLIDKKILYSNHKVDLIIACYGCYEIEISELKSKMDKKNDVLNKVLYYSNAKTQFMGTISHELRTPLNIILSALQVIDLYANYGDLEERCKVYEKYSVVMKQNSYRLLKMINNFMDITQIEDGTSKINFIQGNIVNVIEDVTLAVAAFLKDKGKNIIFDTDVEEKIMIFDKEKIERIILNLLSNAVKFTGKDAHIKVKLHDLGQNIQISIIDDGIGIPEDKKMMIFERFFQLDKTFTRRNEGSGIGLSIVKILVELHDGTIDVKSKVGVGSEFLISIPVRKSDNYKNDYSDNLIRMSSKDKVNMEFSDLLI